MKKTLATITLTALAALCCYADADAQATRRLTAVKAGDYGIVYSLPKTVVDVTIEAELTVKKPGEFFRYAKKYLNIDDPITEESRSVRLLSASITTHGEADTDNRWLITLKGNFAPYMDLTADNLPLSLNAEGMLPSVASVPQAHPWSATPLEGAVARQVITEEMLQSHSSAKRAELAAAQIYALRQSRTDLITGQADQMPPDGKAMELVMASIDAQEAALMAMFVGTESTSTQVETFRVTPDGVGDISKMVLARLSATKGIVSSTDLSGAPVYFSLKIDSRGKFPVNDKGEQLSFPKDGVAYNIPGTATATVSYDGRSVASSVLKLAQLGVTYGMAPAAFTDKKAPIFVRFDPATGAITETGPAPVTAK